MILADGRSAPRDAAPPAVSGEEPAAGLDAAVASALAPGEPGARLRAIAELASVADHDSGAWMVLIELSSHAADEVVREAASQALDARFPGSLHPESPVARSSCEGMPCPSDLRPHRPRR